MSAEAASRYSIVVRRNVGLECAEINVIHWVGGCMASSVLHSRYATSCKAWVVARQLILVLRASGLEHDAVLDSAGEVRCGVLA